MTALAVVVLLLAVLAVAVVALGWVAAVLVALLLARRWAWRAAMRPGGRVKSFLGPSV